jgi:hypothetical protein
MRTDTCKSLDTSTMPGFSSRLFKCTFGFHNQDCSPPVMLKDQIIYLNDNIALYFTNLSCGYKLASVLSQLLPATMSLPTMLALSTSIQPVPLICLEKSMRDGLSAILSQWAELDRKFSEFCELLTFEGNNMNVTIYKKQFCDLQLEWKELNKKSNFILEYKRCHKGMLKRSCPLVRFQIVFALIVHLGYCKAKWNGK